MSQPTSQAIDDMHRLLDRYTKNFPRHQAGPLPIKPFLDVILIVGTRGALGANTLARLLEHKDVKKVYAFNRVHSDGKTSAKRQADEFEWHAISQSLITSPKLVLLEGDTSKKSFSLDQEMYKEVRTNPPLL